MANLNSKKQAFYLAAGSSSAATLPFLNTGDAYAFGYGVNTAGQVVGLSGATSSTPEACVWTQTGGTWGAPVALPNLARRRQSLRSGQRRQQQWRRGWLGLHQRQP